MYEHHHFLVRLSLKGRLTEIWKKTKKYVCYFPQKHLLSEANTDSSKIKYQFSIRGTLASSSIHVSLPPPRLSINPWREVTAVQMAEEEVSSLKNVQYSSVFVCNRWGLVEWAKSLI